MMIKSPNYSIHHPLDRNILDNKILVISITVNQDGITSAGYTISISDMMDIVIDNGHDPKSIDQVVSLYCRDELLLTKADFIEIYADQESADRASDEYCEQTSNYKDGTIEWFKASNMGDYISFYMNELPKRVGYLK